jgi:hypothetical protein
MQPPGSPQGHGSPTSGPSPQGREPQARLWALLVLSIAGSLISAGALLLFVTGELTPQRQPGAAAAAQVVGAVISLTLFWLCARSSAEFEHRLRAHRPEAQALDAAHAARRARLRRHRHRFSPTTMAAFCVFTTSVTVALVALGVRAQSLDSRSGFVQSHGIRSRGTVLAVHNHQYCQALAGGAGKSACIPRADIQVKLSAPVAGVRTTVAYYPYLSFLRRGQVVTVLVDPREPGYAELPGHRDRGAGGWIIFAAAAAVVALLALGEARALVRVMALRARHRPGQTAQLVGS